MKTPDFVSAAARWFSLHWLAVVGWSELIGGLAAGVAFAVESRDVATADLSPWLLWAALGFCALSSLGGGLLLRGHHLGRSLSLAVQAAQVLRLTIGGASWRAAAGLAITVWYSNPGGWDTIVGATAAFRLGGPSEVTFEIGVNLFALLAVYLLVRHRDDAGGTARPSAGEAIDAPSA